MSPARFEPTRSQAAQVEAHELVDQDVEHWSALEPQRLDTRLRPRDVAVMVRTPDVDDLREAALELVAMVGQVRGDGGRLSPLLRTSGGPCRRRTGGRAQPDRALSVVDVSALPQEPMTSLTLPFSCSEPSEYQTSKWTP